MYKRDDQNRSQTSFCLNKDGAEFDADEVLSKVEGEHLQSKCCSI